MNAKHRVLLILCTAVLAGTARGDPFDVWRTEEAVPATAAGALAGVYGCVFGEVGQPLTLVEAVERALCNHPKTRQAWADIRGQAAALGAARSGLLPTVSGSLQSARNHNETRVTDHPELNMNSRAQVRTESVSVQWVLYDFGGRRAAIQQAASLLDAAQASHNDTLQKVFAATVKDYLAAQAAQGALSVAEDVLRLAQVNVQAITARVHKGVVPISDLFQAQTFHAQAVSRRTKAAGQLQAANGTLAGDMALAADVPVALPSVTEGFTPGPEFDASVGELMEQARRNYPGVLAAQAALDAARAQEDKTRAAGLPSLSLVGEYSHNNQPVNTLGLPPYGAQARNRSIGIKLNIPIFEGFGRSYQVAQARADIERKGAALDEVQQKAGLDVWLAYQTLQTASQSVSDSASLRQIAQRSYQAAHERYVAGVGNVLELLNAQTALANAEEQRVQALGDWRNARMQLAGKLGRLGPGALAPL
jgi:outer membrane protein